MTKYIALFCTIVLSVFGTHVTAAPDLKKSIEEIADQNYFRLQAIELLYDKKRDYQKAFQCKTVNEHVSGSRIDALCIEQQQGIPLSLTMFKADNGYITYILVCPAKFDRLDPFNLADQAYQTDEANVAGSPGFSYYMGRTNGWVRDFENIFLTADMGFTKASCWALNKR